MKILERAANIIRYTFRFVGLLQLYATAYSPHLLSPTPFLRANITRRRCS